MAGVSLSKPRARFAWQAWYFLYLHRCQQKLGDILGLMWRRGLLRGRRVTFNTSGSIGVAGVVLAVPAWYFLYLHTCQRKLGHSGTDVAPRSFAWQACHFQHLGLDLRGRRGTFCTSIDVSRSLAAFWD